MLTKQEREVTALIADGLTNKEIARCMFISPGTVRNYVSACLSKLQLTSRSQLATWAIHNQIKRVIVSKPSNPDDYREIDRLLTNIRRIRG